MVDKLASDGLPRDTQSKLWITPAPGEDTAQQRAQQCINQFIAQNPTATVAIIPSAVIVVIRYLRMDTPPPTR